MDTKNRKISIVRIGDQVLFYEKEKWFTEGYYQLREIAEMFGESLSSFTIFGRIMKSPNDVNKLYLLPFDSVPELTVVGPHVKQKGIRSYFFSLPETIWKLKKVTSTHDVSWIMMPSLAGLLGILVASKRTLKVVQLVGEWPILSRRSYTKFGYFIASLTEWLTRFTLRRADLAVFVSNYLKQKYGQNLKCPVVVANESRLRPWMVQKVDRREIHKPLRILYVGRLVPEKGVQFLLEAIAILINDIKCELWIAGNGPYEIELKMKANELGISNFVKWKGWVSWGEELFKIMREADVLVLPSLIEGVGMVHFEAMSQSLPVIASRVGGIPEIVKDGMSGILVDPSDSLSIANAIRRIVMDPTLRQRIAVEGLRVARENVLEEQTGRVAKAILTLIIKKRGEVI